MSQQFILRTFHLMMITSLIFPKHTAFAAMMERIDLQTQETTNDELTHPDLSCVITTVVGNGEAAFSGDGGLAVDASLNQPEGIAVDSQGNLYIADTKNNRIRKVDPNGIIRTILSDQDYDRYFERVQTTEEGDRIINEGKIKIGGLFRPAAVAIRGNGNFVFANRMNIEEIGSDGKIRLVAFSDQTVGNFAFNQNNSLYFTDHQSDTLIFGTVNRLLNPGPRLYETGDWSDPWPSRKLIEDFGPRLHGPTGLRFDEWGNLYVTESGKGQLQRINTLGEAAVVAGNDLLENPEILEGNCGPADQAYLNNPRALAFNGDGLLFIAETGGNRIRKVERDGTISVYVGNGGTGFSGDGDTAVRASLNRPHSITFDDAGNLYIADTGNNRIRKVTCPPIISTEVFSTSLSDSGLPRFQKITDPLSQETSGSFIQSSVVQELSRLAGPVLFTVDPVIDSYPFAPDLFSQGLFQFRAKFRNNSNEPVRLSTYPVLNVKLSGNAIAKNNQRGLPLSTHDVRVGFTVNPMRMSEAQLTTLQPGEEREFLIDRIIDCHKGDSTLSDLCIRDAPEPAGCRTYEIDQPGNYTVGFTYQYVGLDDGLEGLVRHEITSSEITLHIESTSIESQGGGLSAPKNGY